MSAKIGKCDGPEKIKEMNGLVSWFQSFIDVNDAILNVDSYVLQFISAKTCNITHM